MLSTTSPTSPSDTHTFFARAALEEENARGKAITKTFASSGTELQPGFFFYCAGLLPTSPASLRA